MSMISLILGWIGTLAINITLTLGYPGMVFLMALESMVVPLPSELVLPFAGFLSATGQFNFWLVWLAAAVGSLIGSLISYYMGYWGGERFVRTFGKYLLLDEADLNYTENLFKKKGETVIFIARFIPVVRHLISIPAGVGKMDIWKFSIYTVVGASLWNLVLLWLGFYLGQNWREIRHYSEYLSIAVAVLLVLAGVIFFVRHWRHKHFAKRGIDTPAE